MRDRLEILKKLMSSDGSIWVAIDDNESHYLKVLMDEVFGRANFVANVVWQSKDTPGNNATGIAETHNHILAYKSSEEFQPNLLARSAKQIANYTNPDNDPRGPWFTTPLTRVEHRDRDDSCPQEQSGARGFPSKGQSATPPGQDERTGLRGANMVGQGRNAEFPMEKKFLSEVKEGVVNQTWWPYEFAGSTRNASAELKGLFQGEKALEIPNRRNWPFVFWSWPHAPVIGCLIRSGSGTTGAVATRWGGGGSWLNWENTATRTLSRE